ncbi:CBS domain-containing protein [Pseudochelatococcus lubricantis]|uniref:CBS domain-containing protein n=1 Tax=Pseudochelatococcus lubricantis TaxID=1538102 RepID=A0ABX0V0D4_9HYPH|nr:CBS domain-containing protein [Pseudochelatococcus lubricantis]
MPRKPPLTNDSFLPPDTPAGGPAPGDDAGPPSAGRIGIARERRELVSLMTARVGDARVREPLVVDGGTDLVSLCRLLSARGLGDALVRDGERLGIFTTTNLRDALLRPEPPASLPVRAVSTFETISVSIDDELYRALILMLRHRIHRVIVMDGEKVAGLLSQYDLMAFITGHSQLTALQVAQAPDIAALQTAARQVDSLITVLHEDGVRIEVIARLVGALNRQIFDRLWQLLAPAELRANSCLIVMGSEGRGEQIVKTDQDNALLLRDGFSHPDLEAVTEAFTAALISMGYPPCPGGIMLSRPLWRQHVGTFCETLRQWIHGADPEGPMNLAIFLDAAPVAGDPTLLDAARTRVRELMMNDDGYYARFAAAIEQFESGGWWSRLPGLGGRASAQIDLKKRGLFPLVHGVRALALQYGVGETATVARLAALEADGRIDTPFVRDLADALHFLMGMKLSSNLRQMAAGRAPDTMVRLDELGTLDKQALKDSLAIVRRFRQWLERHYRLDVL